MAKIEVYHGTTIDRAKKIIKDKAIYPTSKEIARYKDTTLGFVYVTKNICDAIDFSIRPELGKDTLKFVVFKILIDESELLPDEDEKNWFSTLSAGGSKACFKVNRILKVGEDVVSILCKSSKSDSAISNYIQALQYGEKEIEESEWKNLCQD